MNKITRLIKREKKNTGLFLINVSVFGSRQRRRSTYYYNNNAYMITSLLKSMK